MRRRLTQREKRLVKRLYEVYRATPESHSDMMAWNAHAENVEQDLPWRHHPQRAEYIQDVALRYTRLKAAQR